MFEWLFGKKEDKKEEEIKKGFDSVKKDMDVVGKWIKHLNSQDKQAFNRLNEFGMELSTIKTELGELKESIETINDSIANKQLFKKMPVLSKQTAVYGVQEGVQTAVQTADFYEIFKGLSGNERVIIFTLMNSEMKLSYEDLALMLGKERSTIRGQINAIKQKSEGFIEEITEKNGKKRVFIPAEIREKLSKYAKVRVKKKNKSAVFEKNEEKEESYS